jgi:hypothetical protein
LEKRRREGEVETGSEEEPTLSFDLTGEGEDVGLSPLHHRSA